jgi:hypothetical protein
VLGVTVGNEKLNDCPVFVGRLETRHPALTRFFAFCFAHPAYPLAGIHRVVDQLLKSGSIVAEQVKPSEWQKARRFGAPSRTSVTFSTIRDVSVDQALPHVT